MAIQFKQRSVLPGFGLTMGFTLLYLSLLVLIPLAGLLFKSATISWARVLGGGHRRPGGGLVQTHVRGVAGGGLVNAVFGFVVAWVLVRYAFPGRNLVDALVDLPFAMPTAVSGIALTAIYAPNGWIGRYLDPLGIKVAYTQLGIMVALTFIGLPFVVRTLQPALEDMDKEVEESAASLGATRRQTFCPRDSSRRSCRRC